MKTGTHTQVPVPMTNTMTNILLILKCFISVCFFFVAAAGVEPPAACAACGGMAA
jgi:hypothetical protein